MMCTGCKHLDIDAQVMGTNFRCLLLDCWLDHWWDGCINRPSRALRAKKCREQELYEEKASD